jgi:uncharacterized protein
MAPVGDLFDVRADGTVVLRVHAQPGASREGVVGVHGDALKVAVRAPADRGRANEAVLAVLAELLGVAPSSLALVAGTTSRAKRVAVGLPAERVRNILGAAGVQQPHR